MHGLVATFIGRPTESGGTSGYHLHFSAWDGDRNVFDDPEGENGLSRTPTGSWAACSSMRAA